MSQCNVFDQARRPKSRLSLSVLAISAAALAALFVAGCRHEPSPDSFPSAFQVINCVQDPGNMSASIDGKQVFSKIEHGSSSGLHGARPGNYELALTENPEWAQPVPFGSESIAVDADRHYTAIAYGLPLATNHLSVFSVPKQSDSARAAADQSGKSIVRVFNAAAGADKIDVLVNSIVAFKNVGYGDRSDAIPLAALPYEWSVKPAGDSDDAYGSPITLQLKSGRNYVVVIMGSVTGNNLDIKAYEE